MERTWDGLAKGLTDKTIVGIRKFISEDAWNLVTDEGKADVADVAALYIECGLLEAIGGDTTVAKAALSAALGNWEMSGRIRAAGHVDDFVADLKVALVKAAGIALTLAVTIV